MQSIQKKEKKGEGVGVCRCVLEEGSPLPFLSNWFNWLNIVISVDSIVISIDIPFPVATLGRYFTTLVWHPFPDPPPAPSRSSTISACKDYGLRGKLPDERKRLRPRTWIIQQGVHPHPGPVVGRSGFDDSQATNREESDCSDVDDRSSNDWPIDDRGDGDSGGIDEELEEQFAREQEEEPSDQYLGDLAGMISA